MTENDKTVKMSIEIDADLHRQIKMFAALRGITMKDYVIRLLEADMKKLKKLK